MSTYVIRPGTGGELPPGRYEWTAVVAPDGTTARRAARDADEVCGHAVFERYRSGREFASEVLAGIHREPGMADATLIQLILSRRT